MRLHLFPKSLAGRLAMMLMLTLFVAQIITFALFAGERILSFRNSFRQELFVRLVSIVNLVQDSPPELRDRLLAATSNPGFRVVLADSPLVTVDSDRDADLRTGLAAALGKAVDDVHLAVDGPPPPRDRLDGRADQDERHRPHWRGPKTWLVASVRTTGGAWLNAAADRPPVPPLGRAFLASFLLSAIAVATVGALGIGYASRPLRNLASAADRLGRGEDFEPLPETGPRETRQANIAFNRMRERLERYIRDRTAMLAAIAHDLRTPITSLRLRAEFVEDEDARARILETLAEMQAMTEAVLAFARGDAETEESRPTDVTALAESIVEDMAASGRDVRFEGSPSVTLKVRPFALKRGIGNLIDNAMLYGARARVKLEGDKDEVRILIDDDGPGIPAADLERVFEPFVRLESSRSRETGGAGLGLAIARTVFRAHGGDVRLENRAEGGLRAVASLPV